MTPRENFMAVLSNLPMLRGDAVVVLAGEDGDKRADCAVDLMAHEAAPIIVVTGALDEKPRYHGAKSLRARLMARGVSPERIVVDAYAQNTREQAENVIAMAQAREWKRLLLVVSPYHQYRAYLTFLKVLQEKNLTGDILLLNVPAAVSWFEKPAGVEQSRFGLLAEEVRKIDAYSEHVASYEDGLLYIAHWDGRNDARPAA